MRLLRLAAAAALLALPLGCAHPGGPVVVGGGDRIATPTRPPPGTPALAQTPGSAWLERVLDDTPQVSVGGHLVIAPHPRDSTVRVWDPRTARELLKVTVRPLTAAFAVGPADDIAVIGHGRRLEVYRLDPARHVGSFRVAEPIVPAIDPSLGGSVPTPVISPGGRYVYLPDTGELFDLRDLRTHAGPAGPVRRLGPEELAATFPTTTQRMNGFTPDDATLLSARGFAVRSWPVRGTGGPRTLPCACRRADEPGDGTVLDRGRYAWFPGSGLYGSLVDTRTGRTAAVLKSNFGFTPVLHPIAGGRFASIGTMESARFDYLEIFRRDGRRLSSVRLPYGLVGGDPLDSADQADGYVIMHVRHNEKTGPGRFTTRVLHLG